MFEWPSILVPRTAPLELRNFVKSGPPTITGRSQRVFSDAGAWAMAMQVPVYRPEMVRAWRAMVARLRQGEEIILRWRDPNAPAGARGTGPVVINGAHSLGATSLSLRVFGVTLSEGTYMSIGNHPYLVTEIVSGQPAATNPFSTPGAVWDDLGIWGNRTPGKAVVVTAKILPPLRTPASNGVRADVRDLRMLAEIDEMNSGDLDLDYDRYGTPTIAFNEVPTI